MTEQLAGQAAEGAVPFVMELYAQKARLQLTGERELLSSGMTGVIRVVFTFSGDWDGLKKTAVFSNGAVSIDVPEEQWEGNVCTVPQQVLTTAGKNLMVGLFGTDGEEVALSTVWCSLGRVEPGAALSGTEAMPPEAPIWARLEKRLGQMEGMTPRLVQVLSMTPGADGSTVITLDHSFDEIESACREGRPMAMEISGTILLLTQLISGTSAEFTGTAFVREGTSYCYHCLVPQRGPAVLTALPAGGDLTKAAAEILAQAKASGEFDGAPGPQGEKGDTGPQGPQGETGATGPQGPDGTNAVIWHTNVNPTSSYFVISDLSGPAGAVPSPGHMVVSSYSGRGYFITASNESTVTIANDTVQVTGADGAPGLKGDKGDPGADGGYYTIDVEQLNSRNVKLSFLPSKEGMETILPEVITLPEGQKGEKGETGAQGPAGYTPQKGTDYYTAADKAEMVSAVLAALPTWTGGSY